MSHVLSETPLNVIYGLHLGDRRYRYIGLTKKGVDGRLRSHINTARSRPITPVHKWIEKYGTNNIRIDVIEVCAPEHLGEREQFWIAHYRDLGCPLLNLSEGGEGGSSGVKMSEQTRQKLREARAGTKVSEETRRKLSEAKKGTQHPNFGKPLSPETKAKIGAANKGRRPSEKSIKALMKYVAENRDSAEYRAKLSAGKIGNTNGRRSAHTRFHTNKSVSKPDTCKFCKEDQEKRLST